MLCEGGLTSQSLRGFEGEDGGGRSDGVMPTNLARHPTTTMPCRSAPMDAWLKARQALASE